MLSSKTKVPLSDGWELWIINNGPHSEVVLSFTEGTNKPVRERITIHLTQRKAVQIARALAGISFVPPPLSYADEDDDEDTAPGHRTPSPPYRTDETE